MLGKCHLRFVRFLSSSDCIALAIIVWFLSYASVFAQVYPVRKSANGRYLVDQLNQPFLITGDAPQSLMVNISTSEAEMYFANRASHGFNALWINLLPGRVRRAQQVDPQRVEPMRRAVGEIHFGFAGRNVDHQRLDRKSVV